MEYVLETCVAMMLGLPYCQCEYLTYLPFVVVHEAVQMGRRVRCVRIVDQVVGAVPIVWRRCLTQFGGEGRGSVTVDGPCRCQRGDRSQ